MADENRQHYTTNPSGSFLMGSERESRARRLGKGSEGEENEGKVELTFKWALAHVYRDLQHPHSAWKE